MPRVHRMRVVTDPGLNPDSHFARARWWLYRPGPDGVRLSSAARDVYLWCIAWYGSNKEGSVYADSIYPKQETVAAHLGVSASKVKRSLRELQDWHGLVTAEHGQYTSGPRKGQYRSNRYVFYTGPYPPWDREGKLPLPWKKGKKKDPFKKADGSEPDNGTPDWV